VNHRRKGGTDEGGRPSIKATAAREGGKEGGREGGREGGAVRI
jgi:hypothetical protein